LKILQNNTVKKIPVNIQKKFTTLEESLSVILLGKIRITTYPFHLLINVKTNPYAISHLILTVDKNY